LITDLDSIREELYRDIKVRAPDREVLLVEWLNELLYLFETERLLFGRFDISNMNNTGLVARAYGEKIDRSRHELKREIKATTYHMLKVEKKANWQVQVLFDI
jgi:SHS2 domain-containing protein